MTKATNSVLDLVTPAIDNARFGYAAVFNCNGSMVAARDEDSYLVPVEIGSGLVYDRYTNTLTSPLVEQLQAELSSLKERLASVEQEIAIMKSSSEALDPKS